MGLIGKKKGKMEKVKPWWQRRLERSIEEWRKDLGRIEEIRKGTEVKRKIMDYLVRRYDLVRKGTTTVSTCLKNKIQSASTKIRTFVGKCVALRQNNLFKNNQSQLYKELGGSATGGANQVPSATEAKEFWGGIWSTEKVHDRSAS